MQQNKQLTIKDCFRASFLYSETIISGALGCSRRAVRARLERLQDAGEVHAVKLFAIEPPSHEAEILYVHRPGKTVPTGQLAYIGDKYFRQAPRQLTLWFPSKAFASRYGDYIGSDKLPEECLNKANHHLLQSKVAVALLRRSGLSNWQPERQVERDYDRKRKGVAVPDGILSGRIAIETLGRYPNIERKLRSLESQFSRVQVWGVKV